MKLTGSDIVAAATVNSDRGGEIERLSSRVEALENLLEKLFDSLDSQHRVQIYKSIKGTLKHWDYRKSNVEFES